MKRIAIPAAVAVAVILAFVLTAGPPAATPNPPGAFSFAVFGDAPYYRHEELQHRIVLRHIDAHDLDAAIHIGDIFWRPCSDAMYAKSRGTLDALRHPLIYTPGDNEWSDCWEPRVGGYVPLERLAHLRRTFFREPTRSLGRRRIALTPQPDFPENARWELHGVVFATVHIVGSWNATERFPGRTPADDAESRARTLAAAAWVRETFAFARAANARAVVIAFHANPRFERPQDRAHFQPFLSALEQEVARFGRPVLAAHGDTHTYTADRPLPGAPNLTRLQVPGSPDVGWVRVVVQPDTTWSFSKYVVPRWKYW
ncbi:MAG TPA: hypothetical protein VEU30_02785 [Thermoanaerobaculia bacterium]|nr:hypothetical protein [Thermoanaerobaculia bacterium]